MRIESLLSLGQLSILYQNFYCLMEVVSFIASESRHFLPSFNICPNISYAFPLQHHSFIDNHVTIYQSQQGAQIGVDAGKAAPIFNRSVGLYIMIDITEVKGRTSPVKVDT